MTGQFNPESILNAERFLAKKRQQPFFLSVGIDEPHRNNRPREEVGVGTDGDRFSKTRYYDPEKLHSRYVAPLPFLPDTRPMRREMTSYQEGVKIMDEYMGRILYALEQYGLAENTMVILTTDHGIEFPGCKKTLTDQGIGVMLMMRGPHGFTGGRVIESLVSQLDIFPTLCSILGIERFPWLRGCDLMPIIRGEKESVREEIFGEQTYHGTMEPLRCVRTERYKLVFRHSETGPLCRHDGKSSNAMEEYGWYSRNLGKEEFFDLYLDPMEACNRIHDPACQPQIDDLRARLNRWMGETRDSFPSGNFPPPPPKRTNPVSSSG